MNKHGGYFGENTKEVMDFSVNVNPLGPSEKLIKELKDKLNTIIRYPEIDGETSKNILAEYLSIHPEEIILGNGATELIYLFARALKPKRVLIIEPTFTEYRRAFEMTESDIYSYISRETNDFRWYKEELLKEIRKIKPEVIVLCNPNNPTGVFIDKSEIENILIKMEDIKATIFIDESFIDFTDKESSISLIREYPIYILRSMTKFYAIPGLRLGYGIGNKNIISRLNEMKEPWTLNALALGSTPKLLEDKEYRKEVMNWYTREKKFLYKELKGIRYLDVFSSEGNFFLCKLKKSNAKELKTRLLKENINIRTCEDFLSLDDRYIRLAVRSREDNIKLITALKEILINEI
ncbi:MAG: threonine-phosphate decarboxylase [Firmicutes bacterium]|nr:threonine-phosphate decarboxylase [Bacillota bacterium]